MVPGAVADVVADAVGVREERGRGLVATLVEQLRSWQGLVVLDDCEHRIGASAALVAELLRSCLDLVNALADRSLLQVGERDGVARYVGSRNGFLYGVGDPS